MWAMCVKENWPGIVLYSLQEDYLQGRDYYPKKDVVFLTSKCERDLFGRYPELVEQLVRDH